MKIKHIPHKRRSPQERLERNEQLMPAIEVELTPEERELIAQDLKGIPKTARIGAENTLLSKMRRNGNRIKLEGWERYKVSEMMIKHKTNRPMRLEIAAKVR